MKASAATVRLFRFGVFELDSQSGELRRHGLKVRLPDQSFQILRLLLDRPGEVVSRDAIRQQLWTSDTFVDFNVGLNSAVRKLREALDDSAENPRFVETLPRRGYRFIASVNRAVPDPIAEPTPGGSERERPRSRRSWAAGGLVVAAAIATLAISAAINMRPAPPRESRAAAPRGVDPAAYDAYLKGVAVGGRQTYDGYRNAVAYFEEAVAKQPDFALAYAALAQAQLQFLFGGPLSPRETIPKAEAAARKALQLDETLTEAHLRLGAILHNFYWQWDEGDKELARARELGAGAGDGPMHAALIRRGRFAEAIAESERARTLDPRSFAAYMSLAIAYRASGQYDRAVEEIRRALEIIPGQNRAHFQLGVTYLFMGHLNDAIRELEIAVRSNESNQRLRAYLGYAYAVGHRPLDAQRILNELESRARQEYVSSFGIALVYDALGQREPALAAVERAYQDHAIEFAQLSQYPPFKTIASDPIFHVVMRGVGVPY
jgi:DNA-binding winged helix-turn-helix (wHTH) protein/Tfp pilus assembly protein PilF